MKAIAENYTLGLNISINKRLKDNGKGINMPDWLASECFRDELE